MPLPLLIRSKIVIICFIAVVLILLILNCLFFKDEKLNPYDFKRLKIIEVSVVNRYSSRSVIITKPEQLDSIKKFFLELDGNRAQLNRLNFDGYFMKIYCENHEPFGVFFYRNKDFGNVIELGGEAYYNENFWNYLDSLFNNE